MLQFLYDHEHFKKNPATNCIFNGRGRDQKAFSFLKAEFFSAHAPTNGVERRLLLGTGLHYAVLQRHPPREQRLSTRFKCVSNKNPFRRSDRSLVRCLYVSETCYILAHL